MKKQIFALADCNTFYASCEKVFRPDLKNIPLIVLSNNDGCVVSMSKEAKEAGIKRGIPFFKIEDAVKKHGIRVFSSNYALYGDLSARIMKTLGMFTPDIEIYSIDEAFLDLTGFMHNDPVKYAQKIQNTVYKNTGIPISVGIGETKTLAKLANKIGKKYAKYGGVFNIAGHKEKEKIFSKFDVSDIWGIGFQYAKMLHAHGINSILDFIKTDDIWIKKKMTVKGLYTAWELRGRSCIDIQKNNPDKKNILSSRSFGQPVQTKKQLAESIAYHTTLASQNLREQRSVCSFITVFFSTNRFKKDQPQYSNAETALLDIPHAYTPDLITLALRSLDAVYKPGFEYKNAGVMLGGILPDANAQMSLFDDAAVTGKKNRIIKAVDAINGCHGREKITTGAFSFKKNWAMRRDYKSPDYTADWNDIPVVKA